MTTFPPTILLAVQELRRTSFRGDLYAMRERAQEAERNCRDTDTRLALLWSTIAHGCSVKGWPSIRRRTYLNESEARELLSLCLDDRP